MILTRRTTTVGMALLLLCFSIYLHDIFILLLLEPFSWQVIGIYFPQAWVHFHCPIAGFFRVADFSKPKSAMQLVLCVPRQKSAKLKLHASVACQWPTYLHDQLHQKSPNTPSSEIFSFPLWLGGVLAQMWMSYQKVNNGAAVYFVVHNDISKGFLMFHCTHLATTPSRQNKYKINKSGTTLTTTEQILSRWGNGG